MLWTNMTRMDRNFGEPCRLHLPKATSFNFLAISIFYPHARPQEKQALEANQDSFHSVVGRGLAIKQYRKTPSYCLVITWLMKMSGEYGEDKSS